MKKTVLISVLLVAVSGLAQEPAEQTPIASAAAPEAATPSPAGVETAKNYPLVQFTTPTYADLYCAGFISKQLLPNANYVAGGLHTPNTTKYVSGDIVYMAGGGYQPGAQYTIVRELRNPNRNDAYPGQRSQIAATGQPYSELGRVKILDTRNKTAVAQVEFSCDTILPGDVAVPFAEKPTISYHPPAKFDRFAPPSGRTSGRIVMAKDFDSVLGTGMKVYVNVGADQGLKVGDYLRVARAYEADLKDPVDSLSFKASIGEDTQKKPPSWSHSMFSGHSGPNINVKDLPRRALGQIVVLSVTPTTATAMITFALEDVHAGDEVELEAAQQ